MTASRLLLAPLGLLVSLAVQAGCLQSDPLRMWALAQKSKVMIQALYRQEQSKTGGQPSRNLALLAVHLASEGKLDARSVEYLSRHVQGRPEDHFAKLYEGYAWVFSAEKYSKEKNYLRAAEYLKRGFFLIDEAVDSDPDNWRLRYLRMRLDAFVPSDLGRYVVALKDASLLMQGTDPLPPGLRPFVATLKSSALDRSGKTAVAASDFEAVRTQFRGTEMAALSSPCGLQTFFAAEEINGLLDYALGHDK